MALPSLAGLVRRTQHVNVRRNCRACSFQVSLREIRRNRSRSAMAAALFPKAPLTVARLK